MSPDIAVRASQSTQQLNTSNEHVDGESLSDAASVYSEGGTQYFDANDHFSDISDERPADEGQNPNSEAHDSTLTSVLSSVRNSPLIGAERAGNPEEDEVQSPLDPNRQASGSAAFKVPGMSNWQPARARRVLTREKFNRPPGTDAGSSGQLNAATGRQRFTTNRGPIQPRSTNNTRPNLTNRVGPELQLRDITLGANAAQGGSEGEGLTGEANLLMTAQGVLLGTVIDGRNAVASQQKKNRYTKSLKDMLQEDQTQNPDFLIKDSNRYDMQKVEESAKSGDANKAMRAKEILLKDHINSQVATKQRNRAIYNTSRALIGVTGGVTGAVATHAIAPALAIAAVPALRAAGYTVGAVRSLDPGYILRVNKQHLRNSKAKKIDDIAREEKKSFGDQLKNDAYLSVDNEYFKAIIKTDPQALGGYDSKTIKRIKLFQEGLSQSGTEPGVSSQAEPDVLVLTKEQTSDLIDRLHGEMQEKATRDVNDNMKFARGMIPAAKINEKKSTDAKRQRHDLMADYGYDVIRDLIGADNPTRIATFNQELRAYANRFGDAQSKGIERLVQRDEGFANAYQLIRDMGGGKSESLEVLQKTMRIVAEQHIVDTDRDQAAASGLSGFDPGREKRTVTGALANMMMRR